MNNTIETNQSYKKFKDLNSQTYFWSVAQCYYIRSSACWLSATTAASQLPDDCYLAQHLLHLVDVTPITLNYTMVIGEGIF